MRGRESDADAGGADGAADGTGSTDGRTGHARRAGKNDTDANPPDYDSTRVTPGPRRKRDTDGDRGLFGVGDRNAGIAAAGGRHGVHKPREDLPD